MPGIAGVFGSIVDAVDEPRLLGSVNLAGTAKPVSVDLGEALLAVARLENAPLRGASNYQDERYAVLIQGDLPGVQSIPYPDILAAVEEESYEYLAELSGTFAIAVYDKVAQQLYLVSDRTSQEPLYYRLTHNAAVFSTSLATFARIPRPPRFNAGWLYEQLFFNIPVGQTTPLEGVRRMRPASVLRIDLRTWTETVTAYAGLFETADRLVGGSEGLERAYEVFRARVPVYFDGQDDVACSLTGGYDSRTLLALAPMERHEALRIYTYGVPGCPDLLRARRLAKKLDLEHVSIELDEAFVQGLPALMEATVYLSGGLQGIARSTLAFVYKRLLEKRPGIGAIVSGVSGDHFFRGDGDSPAIISSGLAELFMGTRREEVIDTGLHRALLGRRFDDFAHHVSGVLDDLEERFGRAHAPACHLLYSIYELSPKYFAGEAAIAGNFASFRCPYWDHRIIDLACTSTYSTLTLSRFAATKTAVEKGMLQAHILVRSGFLPKEPIRGRVPADLFDPSPSLVSRCRTLAHRLKARLERRQPIEDWRRWYPEVMEPEVARRLLRPSPLGEYFDEDIVARVFASRHDLHLVRKIASAEILLRLLSNGWHAAIVPGGGEFAWEALGAADGEASGGSTDRSSGWRAAGRSIRR
jgi:asparagine synthetase B (glutamine-hydrolysing)